MTTGTKPDQGPIVISDYDPGWASLYKEERARIQEAIGAWLTDIHHIGSTAVPGLAAKPIIDIMPGIRSLDDSPHIIGPLSQLGYQYIPEYAGDMPERRYFRKPGGHAFRGRGTHHVHAVETTSEFWKRHILFRDYLRAHPEVAEEYAQLKRELASRYGTDDIGYTEAKTEFIRRAEERAQMEIAGRP